MTVHADPQPTTAPCLAYPLGTVVTGRPWQRGIEFAPQHGIVVDLYPTDEYAVVWFPNLGDPAPGTTVHAIRTDKLTNPRPLECAPKRWLHAVHRSGLRAQRSGAFTMPLQVWAVLDRARDEVLAARRAARPAVTP